ncbi:MAG: small subunit ribosomal protein S15 [Parcubacteria group bacterium Gr01-1014_18]|nr:MAG: small subunit ribosomal protein S15 [Parcubacteria group bacterium Greene0416_36]TSC81328.1 MAG: small subunit ribosomal protein S15 [Parcubacteria group bacterium Gr01-1014_18]TSC99486.1 MAG: small subunit ribosomal protein S15 [Parcubacteria group bacterium Greene1014_20]TSD07595.1 MAG: small subunit ribosomal protein S15 [Parcubacteria group bacterium Greene0714_2]
MNKELKEKIMKKYRTHDKDTGSANIQIAILTEEIKMLTEHLQKHKKDFSSRRGLVGKISERRKLLRYLEKHEPENHESLVKKLKIRIPKKIESAKEEIEPTKEEIDELEAGVV